MLKVECESCKAPYQIDERRVPPTGLKMRCPKCGHSFVVKSPTAAGAPEPPKPGPVARPTKPEGMRAQAKTMLGVAPAPPAPPPASPEQMAVPSDFPAVLG